ncbi:hypothetical protein [Methanogenium cariaci]|uniref:hypothetical protein n=1 Tax=Methanogenium cariaci TaxID=2197 RepID=UPI000781896A|nr:hypothetical protein [Methanogenium cariaci]
MADAAPTFHASIAINRSEAFCRRSGRIYRTSLLEEEMGGPPRHLFGDELPFFAHAVPLGEKEVRAYLPVRCADELEPWCGLLAEGIERVISLYRQAGHYAFNMSLFCDAARRPDRGLSCILFSYCPHQSRCHGDGGTPRLWNACISNPLC